jgi:hypothetical protein
MICKIDVSYTSRHTGSYLPPLRAVSSSSITVLISNVPSRADGVNIESVEIKAVNVRGEVCEVVASKAGGNYIVTLPDTFFSLPGIVRSGLVVVAHGADVGGTTAKWILGIGDVEIIALDTGIVPMPENINAESFTKKGADTYVKTKVVNGVQHYCLQTMQYDEEMKAWGAVWSGDYILNDQGQFEEVLNA